MNQGCFYFIKDQYFVDFPDPKLMQNKEIVNGQPHNRPCFYAFQDRTTGLHWMIPLSSRIEKFRNIRNQKIQKYGRCDTIVIGKVLGHEKAFLIQNMCPITSRYIQNEYIDSQNQIPVRINGALERDLRDKARRVLQLVRHGKPLIFPDILAIESALLR